MKLRRFPIFVSLVIVSLIFCFPFYWVVVSSLKTTAGLDLQPPTFYPAQARTFDYKITSTNRVFTADKSQWLLLLPSPDLLNPGQEHSNVGSKGAYYLLLEKTKPTERVKWWEDTKVLQDATPVTKIDFPKISVHRSNGKLFGLLAKEVRQTKDGFDELIFTISPSAIEDSPVTTALNIPHTEVRDPHFEWANYVKALKGPESTIGTKSAGFLLFMRNSLMIAGFAVAGQVFVSCLVAFGFARMRFKGREALFIVLISTLMIPAQVTLIPLFSLYKSIGWVDTFLPLIVPNFAGGAFNIFLIRQFMLGFPKELDESAAIDGASPWRIFRSIILPNCGPVLIIVGLFTFVGSWQDVLGPLIYLDNPKYRTVSLGLEYFRSPYVDNRPVLLAGAVLSMIPVAILFLFAQKYIMSGISTTGLK